MTCETVTVTYTRTGGSSPTASLETADGSPYTGSGYDGSVYTFNKGAKVQLRTGKPTLNRVASITLTDGDGNTQTPTADTETSTSNDYYVFTADKDYTLEVEFIQRTRIGFSGAYSATVSVEGGNAYYSNSYYFVDTNVEITITVTPNAGYRVESVRVGADNYLTTDEEGKYHYTATSTANQTIYVTLASAS